MTYRKYYHKDSFWFGWSVVKTPYDFTVEIDFFRWSFEWWWALDDEPHSN